MLFSDLSVNMPFYLEYQNFNYIEIEDDYILHACIQALISYDVSAGELI